MMRGPSGDRAPSGRGRRRSRAERARTAPSHSSAYDGAATGGTHGQRRASPTSRSIERRGRGPRGNILPRAVPARLAPSEAFDQLALSAFADIDARWHDKLTELDIAVDDIPKISARNPRTIVWPPEVAADGAVPLARLVPAGLARDESPTRARLVLFRRPLELRATRPADLLLLVHDVMVEQIATYLGVTPEVIDPTLSEG